MWVRQLTFHPGGMYVLTCADDKEIRVWDVTTGRCVKTVQASNSFISAITSPLPHATTTLTARKFCTFIHLCVVYVIHKQAHNDGYVCRVMFVSGDVANIVSVWECR